MECIIPCWRDDKHRSLMVLYLRRYGDALEDVGMGKEARLAREEAKTLEAEGRRPSPVAEPDPSEDEPDTSNVESP